MSLHPARDPSPSEVLAASSREIPKSLKTMLLALFGHRRADFHRRPVRRPGSRVARVPRELVVLHRVSRAGVMFVAVQRITTARWSRGVIRFMEGYVAFLPVAFVFLLLTLFVGKATSSGGRTGASNPEKATYFNPAFLIIRDIVVFGSSPCSASGTSTRRCVSTSAIFRSAGAKWAADMRARMRNGFGDERRELHSTHSLQGKLAVFALLFAFGWSVLAWDLSMGLSPHFQSTLYGWWFFMGGWLCALMLFALLVRAWNGT